MAGAIVILGYYVAFFTYFWYYVNAYITNEKTIYIKMRRGGGTRRKWPIVARSPIRVRGPTQTDADMP
jgi:hypothetical protein